ncbi:MAG TPA: dTMP kinase [Methanomicrobiales archaeon]|nr:dTMP kinase [Methanomicrobiales archaeon]
MLITIEGIDGSGKSTLLAGLRESLKDLDPVFTREPGSTWVGEAVRRAVAERADPVTEALLFVADHAAHLETVVRPALEAGRLVISDRYTDSRYAYQGAMLEGMVPDPLAWLHALHDGWTIVPDRTFLLLVPVEKALERLPPEKRREHFEDGPFLERVRANYLALAEAEPARFVLVDALLPAGEVQAFVGDAIRELARRPRSRRRR